VGDRRYLGFAAGGITLRQFLFGVALLIAEPANSQNAVVLVDGNILTLDAEFSVVDSMAFRGNEIIAVGDEARGI